MFKALLKDIKIGAKGVNINLSECSISDSQLTRLRDNVAMDVVVDITPIDDTEDEG